jgi:endonuclease III
MGKKQKRTHTAAEFGLSPLDGDDDLFRWFLLCFMLGKPIQSSVAVNTWQLFLKRGLDTPWAILGKNEHELARILREGKYTRYQHVMARSLLTCMDQLVRMYEGSLWLLLESSRSEDELSKRLRQLHGVGPKTAEIIMRETEEYFAGLNEVY